jgi:ABC-type antimicrobial peptide transport system permease subunit
MQKYSAILGITMSVVSVIIVIAIGESFNKLIDVLDRSTIFSNRSKNNFLTSC